MMDRTRTVLLGTAAAVIGTIGLLMLLGFRHVSNQAAADAPRPASLSHEPLSGVTVILDPGHGGEDPGTTSGPLSEAALTYRTAVELAAALEAQGAKIVYTVRSRSLDPSLAVTEPPPVRPTDAVLAANGEALNLRHSPRPLWQRAGTAGKVWSEQSRRDPEAARNVFFLSLHFDQFTSPDIYGGLVCVDRRTKSVPTLARILAQQMVSGSLARHGDFRGVRDVAGRELGVLNPQYNPVPEKALLEVATLSNPQNAAEADDPVWRSEVVRRIVRAIIQTHSPSAGMQAARS